MKKQLEVKKEKEISVEWEEKEIGKIIIENKKSQIQVNEAGSFGRYNFFTSGESVLKYDSYLIDGENIFMATGGVANVKYYDGKCAYSTDTYSLKSKINTLYLYYNLLLIIDKINFKLFEGTGLKHLQKDKLKQLKLFLTTNVKEQEKIISILQEIDNTIEKTQNIIDKYKKIRNGFIYDFFNRMIDLIGKENNQWKTDQLLKKVKIIDYRGRTPPFSEEGIPYIGSENVKNGSLKLDGCRFVSRETYDKYMTRGIPSNKDIFFTTEAPLGEVARVPDFKFCFAQRVIVFQCEPQMDRDFFLYLLITNKMINQFYSLSTGSTVKGISEKNMKFIKIFYPNDKNEQEKIGGVLSSVDRKIELEQNNLDKLIKIKRGLMQDLLTGKVKVKI